jgi:hypothetical protein
LPINSHFESTPSKRTETISTEKSHIHIQKKPAYPGPGSYNIAGEIGYTPKYLKKEKPFSTLNNSSKK